MTSSTAPNRCSAADTRLAGLDDILIGSLTPNSAPVLAESRPFPRCRVLVVDDNADAGDMLGALLTLFGVTVSVVNSGQHALDALPGFRPHAVLLDIGMPDMDGYEVARRIRASPDHAQVVLIALTGWGQEQDQQKSRAAGFDHHLVKPPDIDKLRSLLTEACRQSVEPMPATI